MKVHGADYLSVVVKVWVESHSVVARSLQINEWWRIWIVNWKIYIELKASIGIWSVRRSSHQHLINNFTIL